MEEIYRTNAKLVYYYLYKLCHNETLAEDLTQETFYQAMRSLERYDGSCKMSVWLCQIAKHLYWNHLRKSRREVQLEDLEELEFEQVDSHSAEEHVIHRCELADVLGEFEKLPASMQELVYLRVSAGLSFREIGVMLGRSENWARVSYYRCKAKLAKCVEGEK